jgi:hypothetical protein
MAHIDMDSGECVADSGWPTQEQLDTNYPYVPCDPAQTPDPQLANGGQAPDPQATAQVMSMYAVDTTPETVTTPSNIPWWNPFNPDFHKTMLLAEQADKTGAYSECISDGEFAARRSCERGQLPPGIEGQRPVDMSDSECEDLWRDGRPALHPAVNASQALTDGETNGWDIGGSAEGKAAVKGVDVKLGISGKYSHSHSRSETDTRGKSLVADYPAVHGYAERCSEKVNE